MSQYKPIMAGHPDTQRRKEEEEESVATTLLHIAALEGDLRKLEQLLGRGAFVDAPDQDLKTPLHLAIQCQLLRSILAATRTGFLVRKTCFKNFRIMLRCLQCSAV